jgi:hypothetical protein
MAIGLEAETRMSNHNAFAFRDSPIKPFLFSEVGLELNGSALTVLSVLARLGNDPWEQAWNWTKLPKAAVIDRLADCIAKMPLCPEALRDAHATASRLILLLPAPERNQRLPPRTEAITSATPKWLPVAFFYCIIAVVLAVNMVVMSAPPGVALSSAAHVLVPDAVPNAGSPR